MSPDREKYKLLCCNVLQREMSAAISASPNVIDPEFLELGLHETPETLRERLQERVDAAEGYDAVLLGYGLCGNGTAGLRARGRPIVLPRAHDCCTLLLGSRSAFLENFGAALSAPWSCAGYLERSRSAERRLEYPELARRYGEDNARYILDLLHPERAERALRFIETPETEALGYAELMRAKAADEGKRFILLRGNARLLRALLAGSWDDDEFLVVPPGKAVVGVYDHDHIVAAE